MRNPRRRPSRYQAAVLAIGACIVFSPQAVTAKKPEPTDLADQPLRVTQAVPANVMLTLSVEWPTGNVQAYNDEVVNGCPGRDGGLSVCYFNPAERALRTNEFNGSNPLYKPKQSLPYIGYFDPYKCYAYNNASVEAERFFVPVGPTGGYVPTLKYTDQPVTSTATCSATWSGNFLNWATSQTIDIFRWSMTGGDRWIDTRTETVLEKARHDGQGGTQQFPEKRVGRAFGTIPVTPPSAVSPYTSSELKISIDNRNNRMTVTPNSGVGGGDFFVRVKVCDPAFPESVTVCTRYSPPGLEGADIDPASVVFKPTGLIQDNSMSVRFGAMGYLLDDAALRDGGVLRARMKFVGPEAPQTGGSGKRSNATAEWEAFTGIFIANPASLDADETNSGYGLSGNDRVTNSGVIQYLNKFGRRNGYKNHDPVSEMFYEGLRYFKNIGPTPEYSNMSLTGNTAVRKVDGFPVITNWDDPLAPPTGYLNVAAWCPKNFFVGISDANTHKDKRLPGNSSTQNESAAQPSNPDTSLDVVTLLNEIIASELSNEGVQLLKSDGSSLTSGPVNCCDGSAYLASLAYYANTRDVRPDAAAIQTKGKQSVRTYFVDVREAGSWGTGVARNDVKRRNQLWVASKYGGFRDVNGNGILDPGDAVVDENLDGTMNARDVWDRDGDLLPDTYFEAATPEAMISGLRTAFQSINAETAASAAVGISTRTVELQAGNGLYRVSYDPRSWSGSVVGLRFVDFDSASGNVSVESRWDAAEKIAAQHWNTGRRIVTMRSNLNENNPTLSGAVPFRWDNLTTQQRTALDNDVRVLEYLRGRQDIPSFRVRIRRDELGVVKPAVLGDIVDSEARVVGRPAGKLSDAFNAGYANFKNTWRDRKEVLYVGANDGMLHAIDASLEGSAGGSELFAYVPSFLFKGPNSPGEDGLLALTDVNYSHRFYVNSTPSIGDVDFNRTASFKTATPDWRSILVGGLGKGGQGYFAIDVTDPTQFSSEVGVAAKVLWEFTDPDMGSSFGAPQVVKTARWGWVVLLASGYNNINKEGSSGKGKGYLFVVDVRTGELLQKISTNIGSNGTPSGFTQVTAYTPDASDGTATEVYGGDLLGNVWRFDFTSSTADVPDPLRFAQLKDAEGVPQPITAGIIVRAAPVTRDRYVFLGTGKLLATSDVGQTQVNTFYALRDGTRLTPWVTATLPTGISFPIVRGKLVRNVDLLLPITKDSGKQGGWFYELPNVGERVVLDAADTDVGKISWLGSIPDSDNPCEPTAAARIYAANFETGQSQLFKPMTLGTLSTERITSFDPKSGIVGMELVRVGGNIRAITTGLQGEIRLSQALLRYLNPRSMNWREITE